MPDNAAKQEIFRTFQARQDRRRDGMAAEIHAETVEAMASSPVETTMTFDEAIAFLSSEGGREDAR